MRHVVVLGLWAALTACGSVDKGHPDAAPDPDAGVDAPPDAPMPMPSGNVRELPAAGGRVSGGGLTFDVELGHAFAQQETTGGGLTFTGQAAVKP